MTPAQIAKIMALVRNHGELAVERAHYLALRRSLSTIEAALRDAPQQAEPLFAAMIAAHPGLREEIAADAERAEFEAWARSADYQSIVDDSLDYPLGRALWQAWQARASKGTL